MDARRDTAARPRHRAPERRRHPAARAGFAVAGVVVLILALAGTGAYVVSRVSGRHAVSIQSSLPPLTVTTGGLAPSPTATSSSASLIPLAPVQYRGYCHSGFPLAGVYSPGRLQIKNTCVAITGTVRATNIEHDGDRHISLINVETRWLNAGNLARSDHAMVAEAVPDLPVDPPAVGSTVTVIGPWVLDTETGWMEIHPVWKVVPAS